MEIDRCKTQAQAEKTADIIAPFMRSELMNELCSGRQFTDYREKRMKLLRGHVNFGIWYQKNVIAPILARSQARRTHGVRWLGTISDELEFAARSKYGRACWSDPDFVKHTFKHTPEARAPQAPPAFVAVQGFRDEPLTDSRRMAGPEQPGQGDQDTGAANGGAGSNALAAMEAPGEPATAVLVT